MAKPPAWSYSSLAQFIMCPRMYEGSRVTKTVPYVENASNKYGKDLHKAAELYIAKETPLPSQFEFILSYLNTLSAIKGTKYCELKLGLAIRDGKFVACDFFAPDVYFRGVADLAIVNDDRAFIVDYKAGKSASYADEKQLALLAAAIFARFPHVRKVKGMLLFVIAKQIIKTEYEYEDRFSIFSKLASDLIRREEAYKTGVFNPIPNGLCKAYCGVKTCLHNGDYSGL
ncbi:MAG: PD-(D/E)XK nuclease family protein [Methylococcaceae bacterium]|nr:PD-(D/E)XK nuclease family protein [Methylococcaceae bacterium]